MTTSFNTLIAPYAQFIADSTDDIGDVTLAVAILECHVQDSLCNDLDLTKAYPLETQSTIGLFLKQCRTERESITLQNDQSVLAKVMRNANFTYMTDNHKNISLFELVSLYS